MSTLITFNVVQAKEINVLRLAPAGGGVAMWTDAVADTLEKNGYKTTTHTFKSCREGYNWFKNNSDKPIIYTSMSDYAILDMINPNHPAACGFETNEQTLVGINGRWWNFICGHKGENDSIKALQTSKDNRIGVWNYPITLNVAKGHMKALGVDGKVIGFASGRELMQAFVSKDIDYIIISTENMAKSLENASCFATAANTENAAKYMTDRVPYDSVADIPFNDFGLWFFTGAQNVDIEKLREVFKNNPSEMYTKVRGNLIPETKSINEQLSDLRNVAKGLNGLID